MTSPRRPPRLAALVPALLLATAGCTDPDRSPMAPADVSPLYSMSPSMVAVLDPSDTYDTDYFGGPAEPFVEACPAGYVAVGMAGTPADWLGWATFIRVKLHCRELLSDGGLGTAVTTIAHPDGDAANLTVVAEVGATCAGLLVGITGQADNARYVSKLGGQCATLAEMLGGAPAGSSSFGPWTMSLSSPGDPQPINAICNPGYAVTGLTGRSGTVLDAIGVRCTRVTEVCPPGTYHDGPGCTLAPPGTFVPEQGMDASLFCPLGHYQPLAGQVSCIAAPVGSYVDVLGATAATLCPDGQTTLQPASTAPAQCVPQPGYTPEGQDVKVTPRDLQSGDPVEKVKLTFDKVETTGETTVEKKALAEPDSPPPPVGYKLPPDETYYDIKTDAKFTDDVTVCIEYGGTAFPKETSVKLLHYEDATWKDITTSVDEADNTVCGKTKSFSPFLVAQEIYPFTGFFRPVDNLPVLNRATAGRAIPIKFSLGGDQGLGIMASGFPLAVAMSCTAGTTTSAVDETVNAGGSSLSYDAASDQYTYVWKTNSAWSNSCRQLVLRFDDGSEVRANFQFTR